ncbi:MAG: glycosyltransferase [Marinilabiliaceae bacterium]|nr:glycosyltransferase [Marinilabiliaceae bacterium]
MSAGVSHLEIKALPPTKIKNKYLRLIFSIVYLWYYLLRYHHRSDNMLIYGTGLALFCFLLSGRTNLWVEQTECPEVVPPFLIPHRVNYWLCKRMRGMLVISNHLKEFFVSKGVNGNNVEVINMIVDPTRFDFVERKLPSNYLAYCGIVSKSKDGVDLLLRSFALYHKVFPEKKLKIIGRFDSDLSKTEIQKYLKEEKIEAFVDIVGLLPPSQMPNILSNAEMLLLCRPNNKQSYYGFPTKLGEYLLSRRPVVVSNVGEIGCFLSNKENALIVQPDSILDFANAMIWCSENPKMANSMAGNGYRVAIENFNNITECKKILSCFNR